MNNQTDLLLQAFSLLSLSLLPPSVATLQLMIQEKQRNRARHVDSAITEYDSQLGLGASPVI